MSPCFVHDDALSKAFCVNDQNVNLHCFHDTARRTSRRGSIRHHHREGFCLYYNEVGLKGRKLSESGSIFAARRLPLRETVTKYGEQVVHGLPGQSCLVQWELVGSGCTGSLLKPRTDNLGMPLRLGAA
jgi:hypothetical protein